MGVSNLIKKTITDKNGVTGTRWVKPDNSPSRPFSGAKPPAPAHPANDASARMQDAMEQLYMDRSTMEGNAYENMWFLAQHAPDCLNRLVDQLSSSSDLSLLWHDKLERMPMFSVNRDERDRELSIQTWERRLDLYPMGIDLIQSIGDHSDNPAVLRGYTASVDNKVYDLLSFGTNTMTRHATEKPDPELAKAVALICIIRGAYDERLWRIPSAHLQYAAIEDDAEFIKDHVEEVTSMVPELVARKSHDRELIESILNVESQALREGML